MKSLCAYGYAGQQAIDLLTLAQPLDASVAGISFSPRNRIPAWKAGRLQKLLGERWLHILELGNRNYKDGLVEFVDLEAGVARVGELLVRQPVILLCACADLLRCHRRLAAKVIVTRFGVSVIHS